MKILKRHNLIRILVTVMWILICSASMVLLVAASKSRDKQLCRGLEVNIHGVSNNFFIDNADVRNVITSYAGDDITGIEVNGFNLVAMEAELKREVWIKNADLYFDNNHVLQASVEEREPIARIFTKGGSTFYIDKTNMMLPLSDRISARLPVFTGFPSDAKVLSKADSNLLKDINKLSIQIQQDSFLMAMIEQVEITPQRHFEMVPKIGDQIILFGTAADAKQKFSKLHLFYKKVMTKYGWNRYSVINLQYKNQVIGKLKGKDDYSADSARTVEIMNAIAINAARAASDSLQSFLQDNERNSTDVSLIQHSLEREEEGESLNVFPKYPVGDPAVPAAPQKVVAEKSVPVIKKQAVKESNKVVKPKAAKPVVTSKPVKAKAAPAKKQSTKPSVPKAKEQPKVVMPKKNDY